MIDNFLLLCSQAPCVEKSGPHIYIIRAHLFCRTTWESTQTRLLPASRSPCTATGHPGGTGSAWTEGHGPKGLCASARLHTQVR